MQYRKFGSTGIKISALGFGLMRLPLLGKNPSQIDEEKAIKMIHNAIDNGVNYFDTAYPYHSNDNTKGGASEPLLAKALRNVYREKVYIATKLPCWLVQSRKDMDRFLNEQLERLETNSIDFYLLHALGKQTWESLVKNNVFDFIDKAKSSGKIKYIGFSFHDKLDLFKDIVDSYDWDFCQIQYNYFDQEFQAGKDGLQYASGKGMGVVIMEPLRGGVLVNKIPQASTDILKQASPKRTNVEWALHWLWAQPEVSVVLSGMTLPEHVEENMRLAKEISNAPWTAKDEESINKAVQIVKELQEVNCTTCGYCMPCPAGVNIPACFSLMNDHYVFNDPVAKLRYDNIVGEVGKASNCTQCGECEEKCPQQIKIMEKLEMVVGLFES
jgi:predicted aldo/keto reductase-like oxidoreductase